LSMRFCIRILAERGTPFKTQRSRPHRTRTPHSLKWVPPEHLYCVPLKRFKIRGSLSKVGHPASVRMVHGIADPSR